jgi:flagellar biosynthetic protein FliO
MRILRLFLKRKRAMAGLGMLAALFVVLSLTSSGTTGQAGKTESGPLQPEPQAETPQDVPGPGMGGMVFKIVGSVLLLIGILYAGVYGMRALSGRTGRRGFDSDAISVLHRTHIAPKKAIYVVKVGERGMVVGVTDSQISHLSDLTEEELGSLRIPEKSRPRSFRQHFLGFTLGTREKL